MIRRYVLAGSCLIGSILYSPIVFAQETSQSFSDILPNTSISGEVLTSYEHYKNFGDDSASPYSSTGGKTYTSQSLNFTHEVSEYESIQGNFSGLWNNSSYRSPFENEYIVEQFSASWEKGDSAIPFIAEVGDYYASFSSRSLQRPLKGARVEIQPVTGDWQHSFVGLSGYNANNYRTFELDNDHYFGASWLTEHERFGAFIVNAVHNEKNIEDAFGNSAESYHQSVASLATEQSFSILDQELRLELETGFLGGNPSNTTTDHTDQSYSAALDGKYSRSIQYGLSFEQNGEYFSPAGGSVSANKRDTQANISFPLPHEIQASVRGQWLESSFESVNPTHTNIYDVRLVGSVFDQDGQGVNVSLDAKTQGSDNKDNTVDTRGHNVGLTLSKRLDSKWNIRGTGQWRYNHNNITANTEMSRGVTLNLDRQIDINGWSGVISPGVTLNGFNGQGDYTQFAPYFSTSLSKGPHSLSANYRFDYTNQDPSNNVTQINQQTASARYSYDQGDFVLSAYSDSYDRTPNRADNTHAYRFGIQLSYPFNRPARKSRDEASYDVVSNNILLTDFDRLWRLNSQSRADVEDMLRTQGYTNVLKRGEKTIAKGIFVNKIQLSQSMVYDFKGGHGLEATALTFTPIETSPSSIERDYQDILEELIKKLGQPTKAYERGDFTSNLAADLAENRLKRIVEWRGSDGNYRFGLPYRLDGKVIFELQKRRQLPNHQNNMWSVAE